jgi:hypothetical protein
MHAKATAVLLILRRAAIAAVIAIACNAVIRDVVRGVYHVPDGFDPFTWPPIIVATLVGVAAGTAVYLGFRRLLRARADRVFRWVAVIVLVLSFITPVTLLWTVPPQYPGTSLVTVLSLELMHLTTAVATILVVPAARTS